MRFHHPQKPQDLVGRGTELADLFLQIRLDGDMALFQALGQPAAGDRRRRRRARSTAPSSSGTPAGFDAYAAHVGALDWAAVSEATGLARAEIDRAVELVRSTDRIIVCWAMGLTQHRNAVATIREIVNFLLLRGMHRPARGRGVPGARPQQRAG